MQNPLLSVKIPGRTFQLPSKGLIYHNNELNDSVSEGEVHVHPLSALTELSLKNPDLLFNGKAIVAVCKECVPEISSPLDLSSKDIDAILFFLRMVTYGSEYRIEVDHKCEGSKTHGYTVNLESILASCKYVDSTTFNPDEFVEIDGFKIFARPIRFRDVINLFQLTGNKKEFDEADIKLLAKTNLLSMIRKVNETENPEHIAQWIETLTTPQVTKITEHANKLNDWGLNHVVEIKCKDCGEIMNVELPLNPVNFFTE